MAQGAVGTTPPRGPVVDPRTGDPTVAWLAFVQALSDRLAAAEAKEQWLDDRVKLLERAVFGV